MVIYNALIVTESRSIILVGGAFERGIPTVVFGPNPMILPPFPNRAGAQVKFVAVTNQGQLIAGGGLTTECWILQNRKWVHHSFLYAKKNRIHPTAVSMSDGIYLFGIESPSILRRGTIKPNEEPICEFLPNDSSVWVEGPRIPLAFR